MVRSLQCKQEVHLQLLYRKIPEYLIEKFGFWGVGLFLFFSFIVYTMFEEVSEGEPLENCSTFRVTDSYNGEDVPGKY